MKTSNLHKIFSFLTMISMAVSCVQDDDFEIPSPDSIEDPAAGIEANISIAAVKTLFSGAPTELTSDLILEGYVVSSDASGNFYEELYIQDHPSEPTAAIRLALDRGDLYLTYAIGRKLFVKLQGLYIGEGNGDVLTIGQESDGEITGISETAISDFVIRSVTSVPIIGKSMRFSEINDSHVGMYIRVSDTQIEETQLDLPFVDADERFDTRRTLESCEEEASFILETSAFSAFKQLIVPDGKGTVSGIVSRDFFGETLLLVLNEALDLDYSEKRCEAQQLD